MSSLLRRELFGPIGEDIWRQLAAETGASFVDGGFWKGDKVEASHAEWRITLENVAYGRAQATRLRAPYVNPDGFRFKVYRKEIFSELGKMLGMQHVEVGQPDFDRDFVIQGTDEAKLRRLFGNARIRELIAAQPRIHFTVKEAPGIFMRYLFDEVPPENVNALEFLILGVIKDKERLRLLFDLFAETLEATDSGRLINSTPNIIAELSLFLGKWMSEKVSEKSSTGVISGSGRLGLISELNLQNLY